VQINHPDTAPTYREVSGGGVRVNSGLAGGGPVCLLQGEEDALNCYRMNYQAGVGEGTERFSPRHHHTFDQIRYLMVGDAQYGDLVIPENTIIYLPESAFYGPLISHEGEGPRTGVEIQFGGAGGNGYPSMAQRRKGVDALALKSGKVEGGMYVTYDENGVRHNQDAFEALWEAIYDQKAHYNKPRYDGQIYMNPENFNWIKDPDHSGVAHKTLGVFTERELRIGFIQLDKGASFSFGEQPAPEALFVTQGAIGFNGTVHPRLSAFGTTAEEEPHTLTADEDSELYYLKLPTF
jgi:hypothetical protein